MLKCQCLDCGKQYLQKEELDMTVKEFTGVDVAKALPFAVDYTQSAEYKRVFKDMLDDLSAGEREKIIAIIRNSMKTGETMRSVANKINSIVQDKERAELIARTETVRVSNEGNLLQFEEKGVERVEYSSAPEDGRLCEKCAALNGKTFTTEQAKGLLPLHPRCRCTLLEVYD